MVMHQAALLDGSTLYALTLQQDGQPQTLEPQAA